MRCSVLKFTVAHHCRLVQPAPLQPEVPATGNTRSLYLLLDNPNLATEVLSDSHLETLKRLRASDNALPLSCVSLAYLRCTYYVRGLGIRATSCWPACQA